MKALKALLYCPKEKPYLVNKERIEIITKKRDHIWLTGERYAYDNWVNGEIVAECDCEMEELELKMEYMGLYYCGKTVNGWDGSLCEESQWDNWQLLDYLGDKIGDKGYAIHISNLDTYADPKKINDYVKGEWIEYSNGPTFFRPKAIKSAPKNMTFIWSKDNGEQYLFIPVKPEQLCKVLNKECSIIIKKRVPKELR